MNDRTDAAVIDLIPAKNRQQVSLCPFCSSHELRGVVQVDEHDVEHHSVECIRCGALGPPAAAAAEAARKWNRRL